MRDLEADIDCIRRLHNFDIVVTLLEYREIEVMQCENFQEVVESSGMQWVHFAVRDKWIPRDTYAFSKLVRNLAGWLNDGRRVLVHCNGGKGRSGTVVASVLLTGSLGSERST